MTRFTKNANGKYVVSGKSFEVLIGSRAQVWHGTAYKTSGGLTKTHLMQNKSGRIVSKAKHGTAKRENRLVKAGYGTKKGSFGYVKLSGKTKKRGGGSKFVDPISNLVNKVSGKIFNHHNRGPLPPMRRGGKSMRGGKGFNPGDYKNTGVVKPKYGGKGFNPGDYKNTGVVKPKYGGARGGGGMYALSPSPYNGAGVGTSGNAVQFAAGNGN